MMHNKYEPRIVWTQLKKSMELNGAALNVNKPCVNFSENSLSKR